MEDYYEYLDSNGVTTLYKLIKDDTVALVDSYSVTINGITTTLDTHINDSDIHTPISNIESMVDTKIAGLVNSAPETLDTLKELSDALGNDSNFATTVVNQISNKADKDTVYTKLETDTLLEGKANSKHTHVVNDITDFPTIPTKVSELSNDSNFVTSIELHDYATKNDLNSKQDALSEEQLSNIDSIPDKANKSDLSTVATSGSYKDLVDKPVIPEGADLSDYYNKGETDKLLNSKANTSDLAVVAKSGNYNDLNNTPTIPTKTSELTNDSGYITSVSWSNVTDKPNFSTVATSGSYNDLSNKPTIPTKVSQLENDMGFGTGGDTSDCVHKTGDEAISGNKTFNNNVAVCGDIYDKNVQADLTQTPASNLYTQYRFADKNDKTMGYVQHVQRTNGINQLTFIVRDSDNVDHGFWITTDKALVPAGNNTYSLGLNGLKWANVYSTNDITNKVITYSVTNHNNTSSMTVSGGSSWDTGSTLFLYGNSHSNYPGAFNLTAKNTTNESKLIGFPNGTLTWGGKNVALDENLVHTSGDEYIHGNKIFSGVIHRYADLTTAGGAQVYGFYDTNANGCGHIYNNAYWTGDAIHNVHGAYNAKSGKSMEIGILSNDAGVGTAYIAGSATNGNLESVTSITEHNGIATMGWVNNPATSTNVVHRSGNETIGGTKTFSSKIIGNLQGNADTATSAASATNATNATQASYSNQLQAFTGDDFTGGNHFVKAIRNSSNWSTRLWMCYNGGAKTSNEISVAYADSAGSANSVAWANVTGRPSIPTTPNAYVTATWRSGSNWYRKWSNGFIEQGGTVWNSGAWETINLHLAFSNTKYQVTTGTYHDITNQNGLVTLCGKTTTSFQAGSKWDLSFKPTYVDWYACGY